ncbi:hypothetical protein JW916_11445 [Candidatus Sumerlaeota bacterium]|nr:hypothetical protein [Candidatus Sumerlaeota bacterium]
MSRNRVLRWGIPLLLLLVVSCGEEKSTSQGPDPLEMQLQKVQQQTADLQTQIAQLKERINGVAAHVAEDKRRLEERIGEMDLLQEHLVSLTLAAESLDTSRKEFDRAESEAKGEKEKKGWPWVVSLMLVVAVIVIIMLFKHLSRDDEIEEESLGDEDFAEENDLGTIRYPGKRDDPGAKPSD